MSGLEDLVAEGKRFLANDSFVDARETFRQVVSMVESDHGLQSKHLIEPLWYLSEAHSAHHQQPCSDVGAAIHELDRAIAIADACSPRDELWLERLLTRVGHLRAVNGLHESAIDSVARARSLVLHRTGDARWQTRMLAEFLLHGAGKPEEALVYARILRLEEEGRGDTPTYVQFLLADCLRRATGQETEARSLIGEILARESEPNTNDDEMKAIARGWLDEVDRRSQPAGL
jgi:hypothetical protein